MNITPPQSAGIIAPPPLLYLCALAIAFLLHAVRPMPIPLSAPALQASGLALILLSGALARWAFAAMKQNGTSPNPRKPSVALATHGPFRWSRNPIYVAMTGLYLGLTLLWNSWWPCWLLLALLPAMHWGVVRREERYLARQFGEAYRAYAARTRRWL